MSTRDVLLAMDPEAQGEHVIKQINLLYRSKLRPSELDLLRQSVVEGSLQAETVLAEAIAALGRIEGDQFLSQLRDTLASLN